MAQPSSKYIKGDKVSYRNLASPAAKCEIVSVHWNKVYSRWEYNILSGSGARQLNVPESDLLTDEKLKQVIPKKKKAKKS